MKRVEHTEGDVSFSLDAPSLLGRTPLWAVWLVLALLGWLVVWLVGWVVVWLAGCLRG